jgi:iron complex outermembrane receptor protein
LLLLASLAVPQARAQSQNQSKDLTGLGLEDLMKLEVTTASKSSEAVSHVPSAIYVITQEMIRRSGATTIPDALRLAPGVDVAQINSTQWAVSIRGFNSRFSDKLLVLLDGRSVYTPDFSGVPWDALDMPMEDIDRIEVIRGPGGSLWGANAVNGVVNIITKNASQTVGGRLSEHFGSYDRSIGTVEEGYQLAPERFARVYLHYRDTAAMDSEPGSPGPDEWKSEVAGFRYDSNSPSSHLMLEGSVLSVHNGEETVVPELTAPYSAVSNNRAGASDWSLVTHWDRSARNGWSEIGQVSVTDDSRKYPEASIERTTADFDYQMKLAHFGNHAFTLGAGYRYSPDRTSAGDLVAFDPTERAQEILSGFVSDQWRLTRKVDLLGGTKIERDSYMGWELEPSLQLLCTSDSRHTYWASVSRAVRTPSRSELNGQSNYAVQPGPGGIPVLVQLVNNPALNSENVVATEVGYRFEPNSRTFVDLAAFDNQYTGLRTVEPVGQTVVTLPIEHIVASYEFQNQLGGRTDGIEAVMRWAAASNWRLTAVCSTFSERLRLAAGSKDQVGLYTGDARGGSPRNQFQIRSGWNFSKRFEFDSDLMYSDAWIDRSAPAYWRLDSRFEWNPAKRVQLSVGITNALVPYHTEIGGQIFALTEQVPRSAYLSASIKF